MEEKLPGRDTVVHLPLHLKWSGPRTYDLADPADKRRVYEIVLREGRAEDIRRYIDPDELIRMWDEIVVPDQVRAAWADYFRFRRGLDMARGRRDAQQAAGPPRKAPSEEV